MPSNEWISSPAGELWLSELTKARYIHISKLTDGIRKDKKPIRQIDEKRLGGYTVGTAEGTDVFLKGINIANINRMWHYWGHVLYVTKLQKVAAEGIVCTQSP